MVVVVRVRERRRQGEPWRAAASCRSGVEDDRLVVQQAMLRQERDLVGCDVLSAELLEVSPDNRASARVKPRLLVRKLNRKLLVHRVGERDQAGLLRAV